MTANNTSIRVETHPATISNLVKMEALKLRKRVMTLVIMALAVLGVPTFMGIFYLASRASDQSVGGVLFPDSISTAAEITTNLGTVALVVLAASMIGSEFSWGTMRTVVGSGVSRARLYWSKVIALFEVSVLFVIAGTVVGGLAGIVFSIVGGHGLDMGSIDGSWLSDEGLAFLRNFYVMLFPIVLAFTVATLTRSFAFGIAMGIGLMVLDPLAGLVLSSLGDFGESLTHLLPSTNQTALIALNDNDVTFSQSLPDPWQAFAVLLLYKVVLLIGAAVSFMRRDVPSSA